MIKEANNIQKQNIRNGTWFLAIYFFLAPLDFLPVIPGISVSRVLIILPIIGNFIYLREAKVRLDRLLIIPILYIMVLIFSSFYSINSTDTMQRIITLALNIGIIIFLSLRSYNIKEINILKRAVLYSGWLVLVLMLLYSDTNNMRGRLTIVVNGYLQDPNYLIGFVIFSIIYYLDEIVKFSKKSSVIKIMIFFTFIFLTGSRGGLIAVIGSLIFCFIILMINNKSRNESIFKLIINIIIFGILLGVIIGKLPEDLIARYTYESTIGTGGTGRMPIWINVMKQYSQLPTLNKLFGVGAGTIKHLTFGKSAHNIWLETLIETGIIGIFVLFSFYLNYLKKAFEMKEHIIISSFIGYIIMGMSLSLYSYKPIWNIMLLIIIIKNNKLDKRVLHKTFYN